MNNVIADYFKTQPVVKAWLFGSYSRGEQRPWSDVDILVQYDRSQPIGLLKIAGMKVDATNDIHPLSEQVKRYIEETDWDEWQQGEDPYTEIDNAAYKQAVESARRMKAKDYSVEDIAEITGLTEEEIEGLKI